MKATDPNSKLTLNIRRADIIDQVIHDARLDLEKKKKEARAVQDLAIQAYVNAVNAAALKVAGPILTSIQKHSGIPVPDSLKADFTFHCDRSERRENKPAYSPEATELVITLRDGDRYGCTLSFRVVVVVSKPLAELRQAALDAADVVAELSNRPHTIVGMYADERRRIIREAIEQMPEGTALLECVRTLREAADRKQEKEKQLKLPQ